MEVAIDSNTAVEVLLADKIGLHALTVKDFVMS